MNAKNLVLTIYAIFGTTIVPQKSNELNNCHVWDWRRRINPIFT